MQERVRVHKQDQEDLSINGLELLGMVITAWAFFGPAGTRPNYGGEKSVPKKGTTCKGGAEPRSRALMRVLGRFEMDSSWSFRTKHVAEIATTLADGISR